MVKLSDRLYRIAEQVPHGCVLADIGSDHALLPTFLVQQGRVEKAVAGELNPGPYDAAVKQVKEAGLAAKIDVRRGDGLSVISAGEATCVTIAGMGGSLIASILQAGLDRLHGVRTLVLQPNVGEEAVRKWLLEHRWLLVKEEILEEDGKIYEILTAVRSEDAEQTNKELYSPKKTGSGKTCLVTEERLLRMGPYLIRQSSPVWMRKWELEIRKLEAIRAGLALSQLDSSKMKEQELARDIEQLRGILACLQTDKR